MTIEVVKPGLSSSFQDLGRVGYQHLGVPVAGAMDELAHRLANVLVGNDDSEATLEITLLGPTLRFGAACTVVVSGADLGAAIDGRSLALHVPVTVAAGATLAFERRRAGLRAYLGVRGGFDVPSVLGSRSTHTRSAIGGRALRHGDSIGLRSLRPAPRAPSMSREAAAIVAALLAAGSERAIRITPGCEWDRFAELSRRAFVAEPYRIGAQSDRMGYRLEGVRLGRSDAREILSEAVAFGTVQVPSDGLPIVLMADRQTTGGYARIAQVAGVDLPRLAQAMPGESVRFATIEVESAQRLLIERETRLAALRSEWRQAW